MSTLLDFFKAIASTSPTVAGKSPVEEGYTTKNVQGTPSIPSVSPQALVSPNQGLQQFLGSAIEQKIQEGELDLQKRALDNAKTQASIQEQKDAVESQKLDAQNVIAQQQAEQARIDRINAEKGSFFEAPNELNAEPEKQDFWGQVGQNVQSQLAGYEGGKPTAFTNMLRVLAANEAPQYGAILEQEVVQRREDAVAKQKLSDLFVKKQAEIEKEKIKAVGDKNKMTMTLRKEYNALPIVKATDEIEGSVSRMASVWNDYANMPSDKRDEKSRLALDQALVIAFNKMLDPGSVVRESEFARTPQGQSVVNRFFGKMDQFTKGGVGLSDSEREELVRTAQLLAEGQRTQLDDVRGFYTKEAKVSGLEPSRIIRDAGSGRTVIAEIPEDEISDESTFYSGSKEDRRQELLRKKGG